jgi:hypothetical protein
VERPIPPGDIVQGLFLGKLEERGDDTRSRHVFRHTPGAELSKDPEPPDASAAHPRAGDPLGEGAVVQETSVFELRDDPGDLIFGMPRTD